MNKLYKNLCYDIKVGFGRNLANYIILAVILVFRTCLIVSEMNRLHPEHIHSCFDVISRFFLGVEGNDITSGSERIAIPFDWLTLQAYIILGIARYPKQDYEECGYNIWIRTKSKSAWWLSKTIWCLLHVAFSYFILMIIVTVIVALSGGDYSLKMANVNNLSSDMTQNLKIYLVLFIMPVIAEFAISMVTMSVCFAFNSILGFLTGFIILVCSIFFYNRFCPGRYMMLYSYFPKTMDYQFSVKFGTVLCLILIVCGLVIGYIAYMKKE